MSTDRETTGIVRSWLEEGVTGMPDRVLEAVLDQLPATRQRRPIWPVRRLPTMSTATRIALAAVAVIALAFIGYRFLSPARNTGSHPQTWTPAPTATPAPLPTDGVLAPGTYSLGSSFPSITFEVPAGWSPCSQSALEESVCLPIVGGEFIAVGFLIVDNVVADPCATDGQRRDPPVGPSVDDLVSAISSLNGFQATAATDITVDGFKGRRFTVTAPTDARCQLKTWTTRNRINGVGVGEVNVIEILDVKGVRVVITGAYFPSQTSEAELSELLGIISSIHIAH